MKAIKFLTVTIFMSAFFLTTVHASTENDPDNIDWAKVKATGSPTLDSLVDKVRQLYDKIFFMEALAGQIQNQLNGTAQVGGIDKLIEDIERFSKEFEKFGVIGGKFLDMAGSDEFVKKVKNEVPVLKYLRAMKNVATVLKAAKIITEKTKTMITKVIPGMKGSATALKKTKSENQGTGKL